MPRKKPTPPSRGRPPGTRDTTPRKNAVVRRLNVGLNQPAADALHTLTWAAGGSERTAIERLLISQPARTIKTQLPKYMTTTIDSLTVSQASLLLLLECAAVDYEGVYQPERLNQADREVMNHWKAEGFIDHGRVASEDVTVSGNRLVWVRLSPEAVAMAHELRAKRIERKWTGRQWKTTAEKRESRTP